MNKRSRIIFQIGIAFVVFVIIIMFFPYLFSKFRFYFFDIEFNEHTGYIGDTIGGVMGPFVAILASILTFLAFWIQYDANAEHVKQFESQSNQNMIDRFESKFFEMVRLHRENVNDLKRQLNPEIRGGIFYSLIKEFMLVYEWTESYVDEYSEYSEDEEGDDLELDAEELGDYKDGVGQDDNDILELKISHIVSQFGSIEILNLAYKTFFVGLQQSSISTLKEHLAQYDNELVDHYLNYITLEKGGFDYFEDEYSPRILEGHLSDLAHYFRHLYQTVKFIVEVPMNLLDDISKYQYVKILRSQLSDYEQLLLIVNSQSEYGAEWLHRNLLSYWKLAKNAPKDQIRHLGLDVDLYFTPFYPKVEGVL